MEPEAMRRAGLRGVAATRHVQSAGCWALHALKGACTPIASTSASSLRKRRACERQTPIQRRTRHSRWERQAGCEARLERGATHWDLEEHRASRVHVDADVVRALVVEGLGREVAEGAEQLVLVLSREDKTSVTTTAVLN
eukprot:3351265-Rhodomonas_salina.3